MIETGVLFDDIHSFRDLNLVLGPFVLPPAKPKTNFIDVPGRDGSIDATEATGEVKYNDREFSFTFTVFPQDELSFEERQTVVSNALNGKRCKITIEKDPDYYLEGRCFVNEHFANKKLRQIVVSVRVAPYKLKHNETVESFELSKYDDIAYNGNSGYFSLIKGTSLKIAGIKKAISVIGQESVQETWRLCKMNLAIRGIAHNLGEKNASTFLETVPMTLLWNIGSM